METEIQIENLEYPNLGIGWHNDKKVSIPFTIPGQTVRARLKKKKGKLEGRLLETLRKAEDEIDPGCPVFGRCGGCTWRQVPYETELAWKETMVLGLLKKDGIQEFEYLGMEAAPSIEGYRNKMEFSFGDEQKDGPLTLGMRRRGSSYEVADGRQCRIVDGDYRQILTAAMDFFQKTGEPFYRKNSHEGTLRHLVLRRGFYTGEILVNAVTTSAFRHSLIPLVESLNALLLEGRIVGILHTLNDSLSDIVQEDRMEVLYGQPFFHDKLFHLDFQISAFSFFQTNTAGAEKLYSTVRAFAGERQRKHIYDLYCGTGTIAQVLGDLGERVTGVELVPEAVVAAERNAQRNGLAHCSFLAGDVLKIVDQLDEKPDLIVLDPPRDGVHPKALKKIADFGVQQMIYVSCKPTSLVRDLEMLKEYGYRAVKVKIHDMFPRTWHVETVVLLSK